MEQDAFEKLAEYALQGRIDPGDQPIGSWFLLPDNTTNIKGQDFAQSHPCLIFGIENARSGVIQVWIRSKSHFELEKDQIPFSLVHRAHVHPPKKVCPCTSDAAVIIRHPKKVPVSIILRNLPQCFESDQSWLRTFSACIEKVHGISLIKKEINKEINP